MEPCLAAIKDDADVSSVWNAVGKRFAFWWRAMSDGTRWAWSVLDKTARIFAVIAILAVSVGGVLLHQSAAVIGAVLGALAVLAFAEGTYRVWSEAEARAQATLPEPIGMSLVDGLRLALKRGENFKSQVKSAPAAVTDAVLLAAAHDWYDGIYKLLIETGAQGEAKHWLDETDALPAAARIDITNVLGAMHAVEGQVGCLKAIISRLETEQ